MGNCLLLFRLTVAAPVLFVILFHTTSALALIFFRFKLLFPVRFCLRFITPPFYRMLLIFSVIPPSALVTVFSSPGILSQLAWFVLTCSIGFLLQHETLSHLLVTLLHYVVLPFLCFTLVVRPEGGRDGGVVVFLTVAVPVAIKSLVHPEAETASNGFAEVESIVGPTEAD